MPHRIAFYDLDKTITRRPTWTPFLLHGGGARLALLPLAMLASAGYPLRLVDRAELKRLTHRLLIGGTTPGERMTERAERFAEQTLRHNLSRAALDRIAADRADGYRLVMATASYDFYVTAIARALGFDAVIATIGQRHHCGAHRPGVDGDNCYGPAKLSRVKAWMAAEGIDRSDTHIRFYSDHVSDAPMLGWADEPFAVNAHRPLRQLAAARGWPLLDWRD